MPFRVRTIDEIVNDVNKKLGIGGGDAFRDPALEPGFRIKGPSELPGYTQELPDAESARLGREYTAAGSNDPSAYSAIPGYGAVSTGFRKLFSPVQGLGEGLVSSAGTLIDPLAYMSGQGTPVADYMLQNERLKMEQGYGKYENFFSNVAKSVTKVFAGSKVAGTAGVALSVFAEPATQSYRRAKEAGWDEPKALAYGAAHGAVEAGTEFLLDKFPGLGGLSAEASKMFSKAVAGDLAQAVAGGVLAKAAQVAKTGAGEGIEEAFAFVLGDLVDRAASNMTGDSRLQKQYATTSEYLWDAAQSFALGAAAGGLISGGMQGLQWYGVRQAMKDIEQQGQQPAQTPPNPAIPDPLNAPQQPTPIADPTLPVQPTGPSQPAAIDPGQVAQPQVAEPFGNSEQLPAPVTAVDPNAAQPLDALPELPRTEREQPDPQSLFDREMMALDTAKPEMVETRYEVASKPADVIAKIASLEKPSRGAFAQALGVKPGNLPSTLDSQTKREYAVQVAQKIQAVEKVNAARREMDDVVNAMQRVNPQAASGALVPIRDLRQQFQNVPKEQFDANLWRMIRARKLAPDRIDNARRLSPQQLDEMLTDGDGNYYIGVKIPGTSGVNPDREEARVGGRGTVRPRQEGEVVPQVDMRNPRMKSVEELNRGDKKWTGTTEIPRTSPQADPIPSSIPLDAPPVTQTYERGAADVLNPTGAGDAMAQGVPSGKVSNVRMESNPNAEEASVVEISDSLERLTERLTGSKTPRGEGGFRQPKDDQSLEGFHNRKNKSVRMKSWSDMPTAAHELAHSIWNFSDVLTWKKGDTRKNRIEAEFIALGKQLYPNGDRVLQTKEGFSEVVRLMVQEGDAKAAQKAPVFVKWFKDRLREKDPEALAEMEKAQGLAKTFWRDMGAQQRAEKQQRGVSGTIAQAIEAMRQARMSAADWLWASRKVFTDIDLKVDDTRTAKGEEKTPVGQRLMDAVRVFSGGTALAKYWFDTNQTDAFMGIVGPSMETILKPLSPGEQESKFWTYLYARRTIAVADPASLAAVNVYRQWLGLEPINPRETGLSVADARQIVAEVEAGSDWDTIQKVAKQFDTFNKNTLKYMVQAAPGVFTSQAINIEQVDPGAWIPLRRDINLSDFAFRQGNGRSGSGQDVGWRFRGSGMPIKNILASVLTETERRIEKANKQAVIEAMLNLVIERDGTQPMNGLGEYIQVLDAPTRDTFEFKRDGKTLHVLLNTRLQRAIGMMNQTDRDALNVVMRMVYGAMRTTTQMVTMMRLALNPAYVFTNRPLGNFIDAVFKTPASMGAKGYKETAEIGAKSVMRFFSIAAESFTQAAFDKTVNAEAAKYLDYVGRAGMEFNVGIRGDELEAARIGRAIGRGAMRDERDMVGWLDSHIDWLKNIGRKASDVAESSFVADQAVATAAYLDANPEVKAKLERGESLTMAEISAMKQTVTDVTGDAADDPLIGKALNRVGMFLPSVGVRYTKAGIRAFRKNPAVILKLGLPLAALVLLKELLKLREDEDYRKWAMQNPNQAVRYTLVEVNGKQVMVPNYTELGLVFVGLPRAIAISMYSADPTAAGAWATAMLGNLAPTGEIPLLSFAWQQGTGTDRWGKPIVSEYSDKPKGYSEPSSPRDRIAEEQYTDRTNPVAKAIAQTPGAVFGRENLDSVERYLKKLPVVGPAVGGTMNMMRSPMRVEHVLNFWTGGTARKINDIAQGRRGAEALFIQSEDKGTLSRPGEMGSEFYATLDRLRKRDADKREPDPKTTPPAELAEWKKQRATEEEQLKLLSAANDVMAVQRRLRNKAPDRNGEKAVASAMSLVADNAMRDLKAKRYDTSPYKIAKRVNEVAEAKIDNEPKKLAGLVYNGVDDLTRAIPLSAPKGTTMAEVRAKFNDDQDRAREFAKASGLSNDEIVTLADQYMGDGLSPGLKRQKLQRLRANLARK